MKRHVTVLLTALVVVLLAGLVAGAEDQEKKDLDRVLLKNGKVVNGKVLAEKWDKVTCGGRSIPTTQVLDIIHYDTPPDFLEALDLIDKGQYDNALFKLKLAQDTPHVRGWLKVYIAYYKAEIEWRRSNWEAARKLYREFLKNYPDSRFIRTASWRIAQSLLNQGSYEAAGDAFGNIFRDSRFSREPLHWKARFWQIYTLEVRGQYMDAYTQYLDTKQKILTSLSREGRDALFSGKKPPEGEAELIHLYFESLYRGHLTQALSGRIDEAYEEFRKLSRKATKALKNLGVIGMAICDVVRLSKLDEITGDAVEKVNAARLALARSFIFFASTNERRAELLYWSGVAALLLNVEEEAKAYFSLVVDVYPDSLVARLCKKELEEIRKTAGKPEEGE